MNEMSEQKLTFLRYEQGEDQYDVLEEKVVYGGTSDQCPTYVHRTPPCQASCPSGHDIRGWLAIARGQDKPADENMAWQEYAFRRMTTANPFPAVMGRVCPAPCEDGCNRNEVDDFVGINAVEQHVGDYAIENGLAFEKPASESGKKIAVIGGGPAGLSAAYFLRQKGHAVTVFEEQDELGGMMRYGIPDYRIPPKVLAAEVKRILDMGVEAKTGCKVGKDVSLADLEKDYDAVFWGLGAAKGRSLPLPGSDAPNCINGVEFLRAFNKGTLQSTDKKMVVIGGGDTSIDVASVARRIGHIKAQHEKDHVENVVWGHTAHDVASGARREDINVVLTSVFPIDKMTAAEREREDAKHEGIEIQGGVMPVEVLVNSSDGRARGIKMAECHMEGMAPVPVEGTEYTIDCDLVVLAVGQMADLDGVEDIGTEGMVKADKGYHVKDKHFAGGDILRPHLLTTAVGHGSIAAESIEHFLTEGETGHRPKVDVHHFNLLDELRQRHLEPGEYNHQQIRGTSEDNFAIHNYEDRSFAEVITHEALFRGHFTYVARNRRKEIQIDADKVLGNYDERLFGLDEEQTQAEAGRCMSCGLCFECDNCVIFCPQDAVHRNKKDERAQGRYVHTEYERCVGCQICRDVCPTGYIQMGL